MSIIKKDQDHQFCKAANDLFEALKSALARKGTDNAFNASENVTVVDLARKVIDIDDRRQKDQGLISIDDVSVCIIESDLDGQFQNTVDQLFETLEKIRTVAPNLSDDAEIVRLARKMIAIDDRRPSKKAVQS